MTWVAKYPNVNCGRLNFLSKNNRHDHSNLIQTAYDYTCSLHFVVFTGRHLNFLPNSIRHGHRNLIQTAYEYSLHFAVITRNV